MKIVVNNTEFDFDIGCRVLKLKYDKCPMEQLEDFWDKIEPLTFKEIAKMPNLEERRVAIFCLGLEKLTKEVNPTLISRETISKTTQWVDKNGETINHEFEDTYELFEVDGSYFSEGLESWRKMANSHYVRCKDTSTDREYLLWVDFDSVKITNGFNYLDRGFEVNSIMAIAWTIQTNVPKGNIEKIVRQGDCILIKPKGKYEPLSRERHLTEKEYRTLLVSES
jgi:hypothetical protein